MMKALFASGFALFLVIACSAGPAVPLGNDSQTSIRSVVSALRAEGIEIRQVQMLDQPFFPVPAHVYTAAGEDLQLYEFPSAAEAERAASQVDPQGSTISNTKVSWMAPPHFFRKGRVLAIHLGTSAPTLAAIQRVMGKPFAGRG